MTDGNKCWYCECAKVRENIDMAKCLSCGKPATTECSQCDAPLCAECADSAYWSNYETPYYGDDD